MAVPICLCHPRVPLGVSLAEPFMQLWGSALSCSHSGEGAPCPAAFLLGCPTKSPSKPACTGAEQAQSSEDDSLFQSSCITDMAAAVCSKPPGKKQQILKAQCHAPATAANWAPLVPQDPGAPQGLQNPMQGEQTCYQIPSLGFGSPGKGSPHTSLQEPHLSLTCCTKKPPSNLNLLVPCAPTHHKAGHSSPQPPAPYHCLLSPLLLSMGEQQLPNPNHLAGRKSCGKQQPTHNKQGEDAPGLGRGRKSSSREAKPLE